MKKSLKALFAAIVLLFSANAFADNFRWSECWCNYGGYIEGGDFLINIESGVNFADFTTYSLSMGSPWYIPPMMVEVNYVQPIWKLPFTFGAFAGMNGYGATYRKYNSSKNDWENTPFSCWNIFFGGQIAYHIMLPPKNLDVYAVTKLIGNVPIITDPAYVSPYFFYAGEGIGAYWFFGKNFAANLELGWPFSKIGFSFKI